MQEMEKRWHRSPPHRQIADNGFRCSPSAPPGRHCRRPACRAAQTTSSTECSSNPPRAGRAASRQVVVDRVASHFIPSHHWRLYHVISENSFPCQSCNKQQHRQIRFEKRAQDTQCHQLRAYLPRALPHAHMATPLFAYTHQRSTRPNMSRVSYPKENQGHRIHNSSDNGRLPHNKISYFGH